MANAAPNPVNLIPDHQTVFRALTLPGWYRRGKFTYRAFMLRPDEEEISLGLSAEGALIGLNSPTYGFASLLVGEIHGLNKGLTVRPNPENEQKAELWGLPPWSDDENLRDVAMAVAEDLAEISEFVPPLPGADAVAQ
jgi:hypothetical protein